MIKEQAQKLAAPYLAANYESIIVTSDNAVYLNGNPLNVLKHAVRNKLQYFVFSGNEPTIEEIQNSIQKDQDQFEKSQDVVKKVVNTATIEMEYSNAIKKADEAFANKDFLLARKRYTETLKIKEGDQYATSQIEKCYAALVEDANPKKVKSEKVDETQAEDNGGNPEPSEKKGKKKK